MSRLDELVAELCPDGVEFAELGTIGKVSMCKRILKNETSQSGEIPFYKIGTFGGDANAYISRETFEKYSQQYPYPKKGDILISAAGTIGRTVVFDGKPAYFQDSNIVWIANDETKVLNVFLKYIYEQQPWRASTGGTIARLYNDNIAKAVIPIPPLPVQREIVRILDNFTELTAELIAELTARQKQYEYYRDYIFDNCNCERMAIADIADTNIGLATSVTKHKRESGVILLHNSDIQQNEIILKNVEFISEEFANKNAGKILHKDDIITVHTGDVGTSAVIDDTFDGAIGFTTITTRIRDKKRVLPAFLCHYLNSHDCKSDIAAMTISDRNNLNQSNFEKLMIPIPKMEEQKRIIDILDRLHAICNNMNSGLPAEIAARQKQYEYYRDKLLSFKERTNGKQSE